MSVMNSMFSTGETFRVVTIHTTEFYSIIQLSRSSSINSTSSFGNINNETLQQFI